MGQPLSMFTTVSAYALQNRACPVHTRHQCDSVTRYQHTHVDVRRRRVAACCILMPARAAAAAAAVALPDVLRHHLCPRKQQRHPSERSAVAYGPQKLNRNARRLL